MNALDQIKSKVHETSDLRAKGHATLLRDMFIIERDGLAYAVFPVCHSRLDRTFLGYRYSLYDVTAGQGVNPEESKYDALTSRLPSLDSVVPTLSGLRRADRLALNEQLEGFAQALLEHGCLTDSERNSYFAYLDERGPKDTPSLVPLYRYFREHYVE